MAPSPSEALAQQQATAAEAPCAHPAIAEKLATRTPDRKLVCPDCEGEVAGTKGACKRCGRAADGELCAGCSIDQAEGVAPLTQAEPPMGCLGHTGPVGNMRRCGLPDGHEGDHAFNATADACKTCGAFVDAGMAYCEACAGDPTKHAFEPEDVDGEGTIECGWCTAAQGDHRLPSPAAVGLEPCPFRESTEGGMACLLAEGHLGDHQLEAATAEPATSTPVPEVDMPWKAEQTGVNDRGERILAVSGKVKFGPEALERKGNDMSSAIRRLNDLRYEAKSTAKRYRDLIDEQSDRLNAIAESWDAGAEDGMISCREVLDHGRGIVELRAVDDDRIVATRTMEDRDRQLPLQLAAAAAEAAHEAPVDQDVPPAPSAEDLAELHEHKAPEVCPVFKPAADDEDQTLCGACGWDVNDHMVCAAFSENAKAPGRCFNCGQFIDEHGAGDDGTAEAQAGA